jgi:2-acylglycerol O-acyltransferase 2
MPYRRPLNIVVGKPIKTMQSKTPSPDYIEEIHGLYMTELKRLWDDWKEEFAPDRVGELEIIE